MSLIFKLANSCRRIPVEKKVSNNDVLVIGTGDSEELARIATLSAALTFVDF